MTTRWSFEKREKKQKKSMNGQSMLGKWINAGMNRWTSMGADCHLYVHCFGEISDFLCSKNLKLWTWDFSWRAAALVALSLPSTWKICRASWGRLFFLSPVNLLNYWVRICRLLLISDTPERPSSNLGTKSSTYSLTASPSQALCRVSQATTKSAFSISPPLT